MLIVEDERRLAVSLAGGLTAEGLAVDICHDGREGLLKAKTVGYDLVVLDVNLPYVNGYRLVTQLRSDGIDVPVLMLTAKDGDYDEAEGLDAGADHYLTKPFSNMVLLARIRALLRRNRGGPTVVLLEYGELLGGELDLRPAAVHPPGTEIHRQLTDPDRPSRRRGVEGGDLAQVWDQAYDGHPNIVEVYVSALRRKVGSEMIRTVRGSGYRLVTDDAEVARIRAGRTALGATGIVAVALVATGLTLLRGKNYLAAQHARLSKRRGPGRAQLAVAHSILVSAYHMLSKNEPYRDLGADWLARRNDEAHARRLVAQLEARSYRAARPRRLAAPIKERVGQSQTR
ncbi:response regulator transcription factor [Kribbella sp. NPDC003505]|uniref:response regulator transcription factor n=1 Tax=Kribbella sp. NPDC003505 TaxID=3154448 RepID=UPI0033B75812